MKRRVVITGIGIWSCIGKNVTEVKESLYEGRSGIGLESERLEYGYRSALTGIVERPKLKGLVDRRLRVKMPEEAEYAYMASKEAFGMAYIDDKYLKEHEVGVIFGNDSSSKSVIEASKIMDVKHDTELLGADLIFQSMNSTVNMNMSTAFHLRGVNSTGIRHGGGRNDAHVLDAEIAVLVVVPETLVLEGVGELCRRYADGLGDSPEGDSQSGALHDILQGGGLGVG